MTVRRVLLRLGRRGRLVTVREWVVRGVPSFKVSYRDAEGKARARFFARPRERGEALAFAEGIAEEQSKPVNAAPPVLTLKELWERYWQEASPSLRPRSRILYTEHWRRFSLFAGPHLAARDMTWETLAAFRVALEAKGLAVSHVRRILSQVRVVYRWAENAGLVPHTTLVNYVYRVSRDRLVESPAEYRLTEFRALLAELNPTHGNQWRPWVALTLCGTQGARQNAVLHLRWEDIDWAAGTVTWRRAWDKQGQERTQPLRADARTALAVAECWTGGAGWILPGYGRRDAEAPYTIQGLWGAIRRAEVTAGVPRMPRRAGHGLRRLLAGEVNALTGDAKLAMDAIGDRDMRQAQRYLKPRQDRIAEAFAEMDREPESGNRMETGSNTDGEG